MTSRFLKSDRLAGATWAQYAMNTLYGGGAGGYIDYPALKAS